jgi:hypothetical protein
MRVKIKLHEFLTSVLVNDEQLHVLAAISQQNLSVHNHYRNSNTRYNTVPSTLDTHLLP